MADPIQPLGGQGPLTDKFAEQMIDLARRLDPNGELTEDAVREAFRLASDGYVRERFVDGQARHDNVRFGATGEGNDQAARGES